ncbi:MAG: hypothetical protein AAF804_02670 [Bacteroidota bacterium]
MNLRERKSQLLHQKAQLVELDAAGQILNSCHGLVDITDQLGRNAFELYPVLYSLQSLLQGHSNPEVPIELPAVHLDLGTGDRIYDFEFWFSPDESARLYWLLIDHTPLYLHIREIQQERNELLIRRKAS